MSARPQVPIYAANQHLVYKTFAAVDAGGSISIHAFGAYYGLAASMCLSKKGSGMEHKHNASIYSSDITAMIGTLFLWIYWVRQLLCSQFIIKSKTAKAAPSHRSVRLVDPELSRIEILGLGITCIAAQLLPFFPHSRATTVHWPCFATPAQLSRTTSSASTP